MSSIIAYTRLDSTPASPNGELLVNQGGFTTIHYCYSACQFREPSKFLQALITSIPQHALLML